MESTSFSENFQNINDFIKNIELSATKLTEELQHEYTNTDPYKETVEFYLGKEFKPKTLADVQLPTDVTPFKLMEQISNIGQKIKNKSQTLTQNLSCDAEKQLNPEAVSMFNDEQGRLNVENYKKYLAFHEFFKTITPETVNKMDPMELTKKICYEYCKSLENF